MTARPSPHDLARDPGSDPGLAPTRPSLYRRLLGGSEGAGATSADGTTKRDEAELAERLDTILNIAERLAATHDRAALFRTVVDETRRSGGVGEGVLATLVDAGFVGLARRVAAADSFIPLGDAARYLLVSEQLIEQGARSLLAR